jgi:cyclopropane-fatty-acyl-phospholipid synthase
MTIEERALTMGRALKPASSLTWLLRNRILAKLDKLTGGKVMLQDEWGEVGLGQSDTSQQIHIQVHNSAFYLEMALGGSNGAAAAYRSGYWSCNNLTGLFSLFIRNIDLLDSMESGLARTGMWWFRRWHCRRANTREGSQKNIHDHYDLGNDFFALFLDETMTYSAGIFVNPTDTLKQASINKLDRICQKLDLDVKDQVIEIGTGWGSFAIHAAKYYGCHVTTTTISRQQYELARERVSAEGLSGQIELLLTDYRDLQGKYDKLVSIEMIEAVGHEYLPEYFKRCAGLLKPHGQMLLQAITMPDDRYEDYLNNTDFIQQFIFPGSCVPSLNAILDASVLRTDLQVSHVENIGPHYADTLRYWLENFMKNKERILGLGYSRDFLRLWEYYLCYCEAGFRERYLGDLQILFSKPACRVPALPRFMDEFRS